jgi:glutathionyl-hydroquinone reductase
MTTNYYINEIKELAKNFDDKIEQQINHKAKNITPSKLKELYDELMEYVYGDNGVKGY